MPLDGAAQLMERLLRMRYGEVSEPSPDLVRQGSPQASLKGRGILFAAREGLL